MKATGFLLLLLVWHTSFSQFVDSFDDGNHSSDPTWFGNTADYMALNNELALGALPVAGSAYLSTVSESINDAKWQFSVRLEFNPSSNNYAEVYLISDQQDLSAPVNGYLVRVGWTLDNISLIRQDGEKRVVIIEGKEGRVGLSTVEVDIIAERTAAGEWQLFSKLNTETGWFNEGFCTDDTYNESAYFGVRCNYTPTRSNKFFFDDFQIVGEPYLDTEAPGVDTLFTTSAKKMVIVFSEALDLASILPVGLELNDEHSPSQITIHSNRIELQFDDSFDVFNSISISGVKDVAGNEISRQLFSFIYISVEPINYGDIIINELFPDPTPPEDLPETEFIEIFNASDRAIYMTKWSLSDKSLQVQLPDLVLLPDSLLVFYPAKSNLNIANGIPLTQWPSLNNTGDEIKIMDSVNVVDKVVYTLDWYRDETKVNGGWSIERLDPYLRCSGRFNWLASEDDRGGTPGQKNSVFRITEDHEPPVLINIYAVSADTLCINFSEPLGELPMVEIESTNIRSMSFPDFDFNKVQITVDPLETRINYTVYLTEVSDCSGNISSPMNSNVVLPEKSEKGDLIISEILFNPEEGLKDYLELYNRSPKYIDLKGWEISNGSSVKLIEGQTILGPNSYIVISPERESIINNYPYARAEHVLENALPVFTNISGSAIISNRHKTLIDSILYHEEWHFTYLKSFDGIALERINFNQPAFSGSNWASASSLENYGTPGYRNSQQAEVLANSPLQIEPKIIVPDANGRDDFATIKIVEKDNALATINIYNLNGQRIIQLSNNELINGISYYTWNGTGEQGGIVPLGHYLVVVDLIKENGKTKSYKELIVVGTGF